VVWVQVSAREFWTVLHGLVFGSLFLAAFAGGLAGLYSLRPELVTVAGVRERIRRLTAGTWVMALAPWYRARPPAGTDITFFPRSFLLSKPTTAAWHTFGMEWKEHVGWFAPLLATAVAFVVAYYGPQLARQDRVRRTVMWLFIVAFAAAGVAGIFGAFLNKIAPIR
jgi:hypothetical protein